MAEVKDLENVEQEATAPAMEETAADSAAPAETRVNLKARWQAIPRKKRRRIIRLCILALLLVIAAVVLLKVLGGKSSDEGEVVTDIVQYGSITSTVQGSGLQRVDLLHSGADIVGLGIAHGLNRHWGTAAHGHIPHHQTLCHGASSLTRA